MARLSLPNRQQQGSSGQESTPRGPGTKLRINEFATKQEAKSASPPVEFGRIGRSLGERGPRLRSRFASLARPVSHNRARQEELRLGIAKRNPDLASGLFWGPLADIHEQVEEAERLGQAPH